MAKRGERITAHQKARLESETDPKRLSARLKKAKGEREIFEPLLDECHRLYLPKRRQFYISSDGNDNAAEIYDETGANSLAEFASRLHDGMTPNFTKFAMLEAGPDVHPRDRATINKDLEEITDYLFDEIWQSNFSQEIAEAYLDAGISVGDLLVEEGGRDLAHHTSIPMTELYLEPGPRDEIGGMFRERELKANLIEHAYKGATFSKELEDLIDSEPDKPLKVVDAIWTDYAADGDAAFSAVFIPTLENEVIRRRRMVGDGCNPFLAFRWGKAAGEVWGRGPALTTLPAVRTMNLTLELLLQNAALNMVGMYHVDDDSIVNTDTITIEPGAIVPRAPNSRGLERIDTGPNSFNLEQILLDNQSLKIRKGLFNDMLADPNRTPATAQEVAVRMADLSSRMAAHFGRLHFEFIQPYMMRLAYLAQKRGAIEMPTIKGQRIRVRAVSPLALNQGQRDIQNLVQYHQIVTALFGPQGAAAQYDETELLPFLREKLSVPERVFLDNDTARQRFAGLMAGQMLGMQAGGGPAGPVQLGQ